MRITRRRDVPDDYTNPATESIDQALARLARQDTRLNPVAPASPTARRGAFGVTRDRLWVALRWAIILGIAWLIWRIGRGAAG